MHIFSFSSILNALTNIFKSKIADVFEQQVSGHVLICQLYCVMIIYFLATKETLWVTVQNSLCKHIPDLSTGRKANYE